jgi:hypothetical protein
MVIVLHGVSARLHDAERPGGQVRDDGSEFTDGPGTATDNGMRAATRPASCNARRVSKAACPGTKTGGRERGLAVSEWFDRNREVSPMDQQPASNAKTKASKSSVSTNPVPSKSAD